ncbi:MAG: glycosyltransferase [Planctomycetes bacterium]|nr:glycosyltransferase [Planctomycetota bacterium]
MKVLRVLTRPNLGGPTRQAVALWHAQRKLGVVTLLVTGVVGDDEDAVDLAHCGIPRRAWPLGEEASREGGHVVLASLRRGVSPLRDLAAWRALRRLVRAFAPDVVHTHTSKAGVLGRIAARCERTRCVAHTFHGHVLHDHLPPLLAAAARRAERALARRTDLLFAVSETCAAELAALGVTTAAMVLPPAVDVAAVRATTRSAARQRLGLATSAKVCGFVGRLAPVKRPELLAAVAARLPDWSFVVLGDGPGRRALAATHLPNLHLLGGHGDAATLLPGFDALLLPSRREGFPLVGVEAAAAGVPTVGFDVPGVRDLRRAVGLGRGVPESEGADGLARALRALPSQRLGGAAVDALLRSCDPAAVGERLVDAYAACLQRASTSR